MTLLPRFGRGTLKQLRQLGTGLTPATTIQGLILRHSPVGDVFALASSAAVLSQRVPQRPFSVSCRDDVKHLMEFDRSDKDRPWTMFYREWYIKRHFDANFSLQEFEQDATKTIFVVSKILASDDVTPLLTEGLVEPKAFAEIKANHAVMEVEQRRKFHIEEGITWMGSRSGQSVETISKATRSGMETVSDMQTRKAPKAFQIAGARVRQIRIVKDEEIGSKAVEITIHFNVSPDVTQTVVKLGNNGSLSGKETLGDEIKKNTMIGYYRFHKDFNKDDGWVLNLVNQRVGLEW